MKTFDIIMSKWKKRDEDNHLYNVVQIPKPLFPLESDAHFELHKMMIANKNLISDTHFQWIVDQIVNDTTGKEVLVIINHVQKILPILHEKVV